MFSWSIPTWTGHGAWNVLKRPESADTISHRLGVVNGQDVKYWRGTASQRDRWINDGDHLSPVSYSRYDAVEPPYLLYLDIELLVFAPESAFRRHSNPIHRHHEFSIHKSNHELCRRRRHLHQHTDWRQSVSSSSISRRQQRTNKQSANESRISIVGQYGNMAGRRRKKLSSSSWKPPYRAPRRLCRRSRSV